MKASAFAFKAMWPTKFRNACAVPQLNQPPCTLIISAPCRSCVGLAHQPGIPPTVAAPKVTLCGTAICSMTPLNGPRPAVPSIWPFICATTDRKAATPTESSWLTGCITNQGAPAPVLFRMLDCLFSTLKSHFAKDGIGAEKDLTHCLQESRAFPNRLTQSSARSVVCSLWPDPDVDTENPFHTELV